MNLGFLERAEQRADEALRHFETLGDAQGVANVLDGKAMATFMAGLISEGVTAFERVVRLFTESHDLARVITPRSTRGHGLVFMGRPEEGLVEIEQALELAVSLGEREAEAYALWQRSEALAALGRSEEAVENARTSLAIAEDLRHREWTAAALRALGTAHRTSGDLDGAEDAYGRGFAASEGIVLFRTWHAAGLALTLLEAGRTEEARPWVAEALGGGPPLGLFDARLAEVRLAVATGDPRTDAWAEELRRDAESAGHQMIALELRSPVS
jgi:tetratricopeptide (TPR) repeat protein